MRVSKAEVARHREEIVAATSRMLRQRGITGVSVADLMQAAGLTHGGFYRHFASKEALVAEAATATFNSILTMLETWTAKKGGKAALADYVAEYLSNKHLEAPEMGCPVAAYGGDVARESELIRAAFRDGIDRLLDWIAGNLSGGLQARRARASELLSMMVGAIVTARSTGDAQRSRELLSIARRRAGVLIEETC
ncbi:MAG: TetR/AcrR family transcriptional regulator [Hyphomicrobium sp.]|jgi:TetR/AcrR family transcriptional repressor of nem operon